MRRAESDGGSGWRIPFGGGSVEDEAALWDEFAKNGYRILYWPMTLAFEQHASAEQWLRESLAPHGSFDIVMWPSVAQRKPEELAGFDLIFIDGGNTYALLDDLQQHRFLEPVRRFVADGGSLYGGSVGAVLAGADIGTAEPFDSNDVGIKDASALNLLSGALSKPHYEPGRDERLQNDVAETLTRVIAVPERSGIVVRYGRVRNVGPESVGIFRPGAVHFISVGETWNL